MHDLSSFVFTSRFVNERFKEQERQVIFLTLQNELGPVLADARFLCTVPYKKKSGGPKKHWNWIHTMAASYKDMLAGFEYDSVPEMADLTTLGRTLPEMKFLARIHVETQQRSFGNQEAAAAPPSRTEQLRILQAFYRPQIISNAWRPSKAEPHRARDDVAAICNISTHRGVRLGLFAAFEPWELQQIDHANHFITRLCVALSLAGDDKAVPESFKGEFSDLFSHADHLVRYIREHPILADAALFTLPLLIQPGRGGEAHELEINSSADLDVQIYRMAPLDFGWQCRRSGSFPDPARDGLKQQQLQRRGVDGAGDPTIEFVGDALDLLPFGWVDALDGYYVNWFGEGLLAIPWVPQYENWDTRSTPLLLGRGAGFALWDRWRVEAIKGLDLFSSLQTGWDVYNKEELPDTDNQISFGPNRILERHR